MCVRLKTFFMEHREGEKIDGKIDWNLNYNFNGAECVCVYGRGLKGMKVDVAIIQNRI